MKNCAIPHYEKQKELWKNSQDEKVYTTGVVYVNNIRARALVVGIVRLLITIGFYVTFGAHWSEDFHKWAQPKIESWTYKELSEVITYLIMCTVNIMLLVSFYKGFRLVYFNRFMDDSASFDVGSYHVGQTHKGNYANIHEAIAYRNAKMAMMSNEDRAKFLIETSALHHALTHPETAAYMNSKMAMMSNESRIAYISGRK